MNDSKASTKEHNHPVQQRSSTLRGGLDPREMGRRSGEARRERRARREQEADTATLTARQRFGVALSKLTQAQLDAVVQKLADDAAAGDTRAVQALARLADQAFGKAQHEEAEEQDDGADFEKLTRAQRAALIAHLLEEGKKQRIAAGEPTDPRETGQ